MRAVILTCLLLFLALPAEAGIMKGAKKALCLAVGVATFPVIAPISYVGQELIVAGCYAAADWRMASYVVQDRFDLLWFEDFCP